MCTGHPLSRRHDTTAIPLCRPKLNVKGRTLSFMYKALPENETSLVATGGTVNTIVASQAAKAAAAPPAVSTGSTYYNATLVVDVVGIINYVDPQAAQKSGLIHIDIGETWLRSSALMVATCCCALLELASPWLCCCRFRRLLPLALLGLVHRSRVH